MDWMNTKRAIFFLLAIAPSALIAQWATLQPPEAKLAIQVVDENGPPVAGARVQIMFEGLDKTPKEGLSDSSGAFTASGETSGVAFYSARKLGFYDAAGRFDFTREKSNQPWQPSEATCKLVLKHIIDPVPMYVRNINITTPKLGVPLGFDLEVGDWVSPYGKGAVPDMVITVTSSFKDAETFDAELDVTFPNRLDGIIAFSGSPNSGSALTSPHRAPMTGYVHSWSRQISRRPGQGRSDSAVAGDTNYVFRVRCKEDDRGNLMEANYGKIYGEIGFGGFAQATPSISLWYYFNPKVNSLSLEFDRAKNLAGERINKP